MYQLRETQFRKLDSFSIPYSDEQKLFKNLAKFHYESVSVQENKIGDTDTTKWIGKHVPISLSISSNLIEQTIFLCNSNPGAFVLSFVDALDLLATQSGAQIEQKFLEIETGVKIKLNQIFSNPKHRRCRKETVSAFEDGCYKEEQEEIEQDVSTQFLQTRKYHLIDLQDHPENIATFF